MNNTVQFPKNHSDEIEKDFAISDIGYGILRLERYITKHTTDSLTPYDRQMIEAQKNALERIFSYFQEEFND